MKKMKITSIMLVAIMIGISSASIAGSVKLVGDIDVTIDEYFGIVTPIISIDNQSILLNADIENDDENISYHVNETVVIDLDITDNSGRDKFFFPRTITYCAIVTRPFSDAKLLPIAGLIGRLFPVVELFKSANVVDSTIAGEKVASINLSFDYYLPSNASYDNGEELTLHLYIMGIMPGNSDDGVSEQIPFIVSKKIGLDITYN